jgi:hypothetical protein
VGADGTRDKAFTGVDASMRCKLPDGSGVTVEPDVEPQLVDRKAKKAVYCSCRCDGPDKNARYCECPSGYKCTLLNEIPLGASQLLGSYCVRNGTAYVKSAVTSSNVCDATNTSDPNFTCGYEGYSPNVNPF